MIIKILEHTGTFAENKDVARDIRLNEIMPAIAKKDEVVMDFDGVSGATQSFMHALISDVIRKYGEDSIDLLVFKNCSELVREIVITVTDYMQETA
jgi:hypothetical protein